ncbi:hypothetical protein [Sphingomonas sp. Leaf38]|uniref:hypothetical protein n=1 Tax=Sphingomonas sp. Leaf38 TaxID=1736217 RepID=UPI001F2F73BF|nr:hypothetical protein [Sphingomonas sp. Leaf38]
MGAALIRVARNSVVNVIAMFTSAIEVMAIKPTSPTSRTSLSPTGTRLRAIPLEPLPWDNPRKRRTSPHGSVAKIPAGRTGGLGTSNGSDGRRSYVGGTAGG